MDGTKSSDIVGHASRGRPSQMTCGYVRLICEEPLKPPEGQQGQPLVLDVEEEFVVETTDRLLSQGWKLISKWNL
jgi:hypothetical protein